MLVIRQANGQPQPGTSATPGMEGRLGCASEYHVQVMERCRGPNEPGSGVPVADLVGYTTLDWQRVLDGISTAGIFLPRGCCDQVANIATWRHELTMFRDEEPVWQGPITRIADRRSGVTIRAADMLAWLTRRVIHMLHCYRDGCGGPAPATTIALDLAVDGFRGVPAELTDVPGGILDDPCGVEYTGVEGPSLRTISRRYRPNSQYVYSALRDLAEAHIDYTTVGRRIVIMREGYELGRTALLTCDHFADDVGYVEDGSLATTRAVVRGEGVVGAAGGVDAYYGLLEQLQEDRNIDRTKDAVDEARDIVAAQRPPVRYIDMGTGGQLTSDAPVDITQLVPGVTVPTVLDCTCRQVAEDTRLGQVDVTLGAQGEQVAVTLLSPRTDEIDITGMEAI